MDAPRTLTSIQLLPDTHWNRNSDKTPFAALSMVTARPPLIASDDVSVYPCSPTPVNVWSSSRSLAWAGPGIARTLTKTSEGPGDCSAKPSGRGSWRPLVPLSKAPNCCPAAVNTHPCDNPPVGTSAPFNPGEVEDGWLEIPVRGTSGDDPSMTKVMSGIEVI